MIRRQESDQQCDNKLIMLHTYVDLLCSAHIHSEAVGDRGSACEGSVLMEPDCRKIGDKNCPLSISNGATVTLVLESIRLVHRVPYIPDTFDKLPHTQR